MKYNIEELKNLPLIIPANNQNEVRSVKYKAVSTFQGIGCFFQLIILLCKLPFILIPVIYKFRKNTKTIENNYQKKIKSVQIDNSFFYNMIKIEPVSSGDSLHFKMNYHALKWFSFKIKETFSADNTVELVYPSILGSEKKLPQQNGFHDHLSMGDSGYELVVGLSGNDKFFINSSTILAASLQTWQKFADILSDIADKNESTLIVLDKFQTEWCDDSSAGRFMIEFHSHF